MHIVLNGVLEVKEKLSGFVYDVPNNNRLHTCFWSTFRRRRWGEGGAGGNRWQGQTTELRGCFRPADGGPVTAGAGGLTNPTFVSGQWQLTGLRPRVSTPVRAGGHLPSPQ